MVIEGYVDVLVRTNGRHMYCQVCKSRYVVYLFLVLINDVISEAAWLLYDVLYTMLSS